MPTDDHNPTEPAEDVPPVAAAANASEPASVGEFIPAQMDPAPAETASVPVSSSELGGAADPESVVGTPAKKKRSTKKKSATKRAKRARPRRAAKGVTVESESAQRGDARQPAPNLFADPLVPANANLSAPGEPANASQFAADEESDAFPFLEGGSSEHDHAGDDIVAEAVREALENGGSEGATEPEHANAESAPVAADREIEPASAHADPASTEAAANPASSAHDSRRSARFLAVAKSRLPVSLKRTAVRSLAACVIAIAAGFGYGAAVRTFFGGKHSGLSEENQSSAHDGAAADESSTPKATAAGHSAASDEAVKPAADSSSHDASAPASTAAVEQEHGAAPSPRSSATVSQEKFEMPALDSALPRKEHALSIGRQRLNEGDALAARRIATSFLLREDGLTANDRLLVPQAYALLADSLKVEWDRKHPKSKESVEVLGLPAPTARSSSVEGPGEAITPTNGEGDSPATTELPKQDEAEQDHAGDRR